MIRNFFSFLLFLFVVLHSTQGAPHLYRRHHSYYHHRSPYHVNYSPFSLPKRTYFGVESSAFPNDLEEPVANDQVKGGIKNSNPTQIKTPMKLFSERKNGYQFGSSLSSLQEKFSEAKRVNPGSLKSQQISPDNSVIYPSIDSDLNEETANLPVLAEPIRKPTKGSTKGSSDAKSKINSKTKQTSQNAEIAEAFPSSAKPSLSEDPTKIESPTKVESPIKVDSPAKDETSKESSIVASNERAISNESNPDVKTNSLDSKLLSPSSTEQPATTLSPSASPMASSESSLEIKEVKVDIVASDVVKIESNDALKSEAKPEAVKVESIVIKEVVKPESGPESVVNKLETPVKSAESIVSPAHEPVTVKVDAQPVSEPKQPTVESVLPAETILDVRKKPSEVVSPSITAISSAISPEQTVPKIESNVSPVAELSPVKSVSSVDVPPVSANTESSLLLENETGSPLIN